MAHYKYSNQQTQVRKLKCVDSCTVHVTYVSCEISCVLYFIILPSFHLVPGSVCIFSFSTSFSAFLLVCLFLPSFSHPSLPPFFLPFFLPYPHPFRLPSFFPSFSIPSFPSHLSYITPSLPSSHLSSIPSSQSFQLALKYFLVWILFSVDVHECILHMTISFKNG